MPSTQFRDTGEPPKPEDRVLSSGFKEVETPATLAGVMTQFAQGANDLVFLPEAAMISLGRHLGFVEEGEDYVGPLRELFGGDITPANEAERAARTAGRIFMENLPFVGTTMKAATAAQVGTRGITTIPAFNNTPQMAQQIREQIFRQFRSHPQLAFFLEQLSAFSAGTAIGVAEQKGASPTTQTIIGLTAGAVPATAPTVGKEAAKAGGRLAIKATEKIPVVGDPMARFLTGFRDWLNPKTYQRVAQNQLAREVEESIGRQAEANIAETREVWEFLGLRNAQIQPSIAEASDVPSLIARQQALESSARGRDLDDLVDRKIKMAEDLIWNNRFRPEYADESHDPVPVVVDAVTTRVNHVIRDMDQEISRLNIQRAERGQPVEINRPKTGQNMRERYRELRQETTERLHAEAAEQGLNLRTYLFDIDPFIQAITKGKKALFSPLSKDSWDALPKSVKRILGNKGPTTFEDIQTHLDDLSGSIQALKEKGLNRRAQKVIEFKKKYEDYIFKMDPSLLFGKGNPNVIRDWMAFRQRWYSEVIERFDRGTAYQLADGSYYMQDEKIASLFIGSESGVKDFKRLFGNDPGMYSALENTILDDLWRSPRMFDKDGYIKGEQLEAWIRQNDNWLREIPGLRNDLSSVALTEQRLASRVSALDRRKRTIQKQLLDSWLDNDSTKVIEQAIGSPRLAKQLRDLSRETHTEQALADAVWEIAQNKLSAKPGDLPDPREYARWLDRNKSTLNGLLLDKTHYKALQKILRGIEIVSRTPVPRGRPEAATIISKAEEAIGIKVPMMASRAFAAQLDKVTYKWLTVEAGARFANSFLHRHQDALLYRSMFDKDLAIAVEQAMDSQYRFIPERMANLNTWLILSGEPLARSALIQEIPFEQLGIDTEKDRKIVQDRNHPRPTGKTGRNKPR